MTTDAGVVGVPDVSGDVDRPNGKDTGGAKGRTSEAGSDYNEYGYYGEDQDFNDYQDYSYHDCDYKYGRVINPTARHQGWSCGVVNHDCQHTYDKGGGYLGKM